MIIRSGGESLLLITQPDHAALAAIVMSGWQDPALAASPRRDVILFATHHHDDGWLEVDEAPLVDAEGALLDFVAAPERVRFGIWPRAVERLRETPYAAALVAQHALHIYEGHRNQGHAAAFFAEMETLRDRNLADAAPLTLNELLADYSFVRMGDTLSLAFCNGWTKPRRHGSHEIRLTGSRLSVAPDPFEGRDIPLAVRARMLPAVRFSPAEASAAFERAPEVLVKGVASGLRPARALHR